MCNMEDKGCRPSSLLSFLSPTCALDISWPGPQQSTLFALSAIRTLMCISDGVSWSLKVGTYKISSPHASYQQKEDAAELHRDGRVSCLQPLGLLFSGSSLPA